MIQVLYDFPLPNNGDRYDLSKEELIQLLQNAYENGRKVTKEVAEVYCSWASSTEEENE